MHWAVHCCTEPRTSRRRRLGFFSQRKDLRLDWVGLFQVVPYVASDWKDFSIFRTLKRDQEGHQASVRSWLDLGA